MKTLIGLVTMMVFAGMAMAADVNVTLEWDVHPEPDVLMYRVKVGTSPGVYTKTVDVTGATRTTIKLPEGVMHYAVVSALNTSFVESENSDELPFQPGPGTKPAKPGRPRKAAGVTLSFGLMKLEVAVNGPRREDQEDQ